MVPTFTLIAIPSLHRAISLALITSPEKCVTDETQEGSGTVTERAVCSPTEINCAVQKLPIEVIQNNLPGTKKKH